MLKWVLNKEKWNVSVINFLIFQWFSNKKRFDGKYLKNNLRYSFNLKQYFFNYKLILYFKKLYKIKD